MHVSSNKLAKLSEPWFLTYKMGMIILLSFRDGCRGSLLLISLASIPHFFQQHAQLSLGNPLTPHSQNVCSWEILAGRSDGLRSGHVTRIGPLRASWLNTMAFVCEQIVRRLWSRELDIKVRAAVTLLPLQRRFWNCAVTLLGAWRWSPVSKRQNEEIQRSGVTRTLYKPLLTALPKISHDDGLFSYGTVRRG